MLRSKLKKLAGKEDPEATTVEEEDDSATEVKNIKMLNYIRNQFIARGGWVGSISMSRGSTISEQEYSVDVGAEDIAVTDPPCAYETESEVSSVVVKMTKKILDNLQKKAHCWRNVPYKDNASIALSMSLPLGPFSIGLEVSAEVESILNSSADEKAGADAAL
jgi:hypothetical protein